MLTVHLKKCEMTELFVTGKAVPIEDALISVT